MTPSALSVTVLLFVLTLAVYRPAAAQLTPTTSCAAGLTTISPTWTIRSFELVVTASTSPPYRLLVNGSSPGPVLEVDEFDVVQVNVTSLLGNGSLTAVHWYGLTQFSTPYSDGVAGVTQCGLAGGRTITYTFCAFPAGDYLYRGLNGLQTVNGLYGPLVIRPALNLSANASLPAGVQLVNGTAVYPVALDVMAADLYSGSDVALINSSLLGAANSLPVPVGVLVNGQLSNSSHLYINTSLNQPVTLRLSNVGAYGGFAFSIDGFALNLSQIDGSSVAPLPLSSVRLSVGQRATVTVDFSSLRNFSSVLMRVSRSPLIAAASSSSSSSTGNSSSNSSSSSSAQSAQSVNSWVGVIHIDSAANDTSFPAYAAGNASSSSAAPVSPVNASCGDLNCLAAQPTDYRGLGSDYYGVDTVLGLPAPSSSLTLVVTQSAGNLPVINNASYDPMPLDSLLASQTELSPLYATILGLYTASAGNATAQPPIIPPSGNSEYELSALGSTLDVMVMNQDSVEHALHLHGHHFLIVSASDNTQAEFLYSGQYLLRDTVAVPALGWAWLRFPANNPGVWLLCSASDWWFSEGLAVLMQESSSALTPDFTVLPQDQLLLCNASIQTEVATGLALWHSEHDPITYATSSLSQDSRIVIGSVVGGGSAALLVLIICCTVFGIRPHLDKERKRRQEQAADASAKEPMAGGVSSTGPASVTALPEHNASSVQLPEAPGVYTV